MERWYALQVKAGLLSTAVWNLDKQNFETFFPKIQYKIRKGEVRVEQLFRGYGFVVLDVKQPGWQAVNGTKGVIRLLPRHTEEPLPLRVGFVESLREYDPIEIDRFGELLDDLASGVTVDIIRGAATGLRGVVNELRGRFAEVVFPDITGKIGNPLLVPVDALAVVDTALTRKKARERAWLYRKDMP